MPQEYQYPFELRHLVTFREVARTLHFRKAAEAMAIAQPALSRQIAQLESALGVRLFNRSSRKVELTPAGAALAERLEPILSELARACRPDMKAVSEGQVGRLRVAFTGLAMATVLPDILHGFHRRFPGIRVELNESPTSSQIAALQAGEIDCGFFHPDSPTPGIGTTLLLRERNGVLLPADHPLRGRRSLSLKDLGGTPFVLFPRTHNPGFYDRVLARFRPGGRCPADSRGGMAPVQRRRPCARGRRRHVRVPLGGKESTGEGALQEAHRPRTGKQASRRLADFASASTRARRAPRGCRRTCST